MDEKIYKLNLNIDLLNKVYDDCTVYKSDALLKETRFINGTDFLLTKLAESIRASATVIKSLSGAGSSFAAETDKGEHIFYFRFGTDLKMSENDIIFYKYTGKEAHRNDRRFINLVKAPFTVTVHRSKDSSGVFAKLYSLSGTDGVNFPLLNDKQLEIVTAEEGNVLVQGVAGSGKTNVCIDRIIFSACRGYSGKILYSTYSRGLLVETENKVRAFTNAVKGFNSELKQGKVKVSGNIQHAVENRLGVTLTGDTEVKIIAELDNIINYLETKVDYFLISDLYRASTGKSVKLADENYFINDYAKNIKNYRLAGNLEKIKHLEYEIIYKEIFGMLLGYSEGLPSLEDYISRRSNGYTQFECETMYAIAKDYANYLLSYGYADNNTMSRELIDSPTELYSLVILDEVQDFTQINLLLFKKLARKLFCVGDALQMINPSYFSFAFLKRMMYEEDVTAVKELTHNYRNTSRLNGIIEKLNDINSVQFGTHSFVLHGESVDSGVATTAIYTDGNFLNSLEKIDLANCTLVVGGTKKKEDLRTRFQAPEILTVSEIKGLERETVVLVDILSDNAEKWEKLYRDAIRKKTADENSPYRYWLNLLYVGISRARRNLIVCERKNIRLFNDFFAENFDNTSASYAVAELSRLIGKGQPDELKIYSRIDEFISQGQYDNATFAAHSLSDNVDVTLQTNRIRVYSNFVKDGNYKDAGIAFWELGLASEAKKYFELSGNANLSSLVDACSGGDGSQLDAGIAQFYPDLADNEVARRLIIDTVNKDLSRIRATQKELKKKINALKNSTRKGAQE